MKARQKAGHPLLTLATTFLTGAAAGLCFLGGADFIDPQAAQALLDLHGDGLDVKDVWAFAWIFGQAAILVHHVMPGMPRD